jgi:hypothetical protein
MTMRETVRSGLLVIGLMGGVIVGGTVHVGSVPIRNRSSAAQNTLRDSTEAVVAAAYAREFGETIRRPAIFTEPLGSGCKDPHLTTTAYFRTSPTSARLLYLYSTVDGGTVIRKSRVASVVAPSGTFRVLVMMVRHPATVRDSDLENWEAAQAKINRDHASFASNRGFPEPIVSFANTNVLVDASDITDPRSVAAVRVAAERKGFVTASYQFIAVINIDPEKPEGGFAGAAGFLYMGNYSRWSRPLTAPEWVNVANAVYHHEVAHHWGWPGSHDWARGCRVRPPYEPFIVPPVLFGWEDVDGDRIPEILDATPYGREQ